MAATGDAPVIEALNQTYPGLLQSLIVKAQRVELDEIGRVVGTPVVYLKAAWAEPVLYGGRGGRVGSDIDILVRRDSFMPFVAALGQRGFVHYGVTSPAYDRYFGEKEWAFRAPKGSFPVDLHRALTEPFWYDLNPNDLIARARLWDSVDGPILSLSTEDQLLYAAAHYANHLYDHDSHHIDDCQRIIDHHPIDWTTVRTRAEQAGLRLALFFLIEALRLRGADIPASITAWSSPLFDLRRRLAARWIATTPNLRLRRKRSTLFDYLVLRPLLSERPEALPQVVATYGLPWAKEQLAKRLARSFGR